METLVTPIFNATWERALTQIENKTPADSIVLTWWPPGHFIKAIAHRQVTFDGGTINFPQAYWIANIFLGQNETEALGLVRMLNDSANQAAEYLQKMGLDLSTGVTILKEISKMNIGEAREKLLKIFDHRIEFVEPLLALTHKDPPPSYILVYNEFVEDNIQLKFIGHWNFKKIEDINRNPELLKKVPDRQSPEYIQFLWALAGGQYRYHGPLTQINQTSDIALFEENIAVNLVTKEVKIASKTFGSGVPISLFYVDDDQFIENKFADSTLPYCVVLFKNTDRYSILLMDRPLAQSLFVRLFFFDGKGYQYIKPFLREFDLTRRTEICVFEINWDKFAQDLAR